MFQSQQIIGHLTSTGGRCQLKSGSLCPIVPNDRIKIATKNVRFIKPKIFPFTEYVTYQNLYIVAVTETRFKHDETQSTIADISPPGYSYFTSRVRISGQDEV